MGEAAADRAAVADLVVRDMANCFHEERMRAMQFLVAFDIAPARERAQSNSVGIDCNAPQLGNAADVDEKARRRQSKGEDRNEALSAGNHFGFVTVLGQERDRAFQAVGADILEACSLHCDGPGRIGLLAYKQFGDARNARTAAAVEVFTCSR